MSSHSLIAVIATLAVTACSSSPFTPDEARELGSARARWQQRPFADYSFETTHGCFCPPELIGPVRIVVRQGAIESVTRLDTGDTAPPTDWYTIEDLFERIPDFGDQDGVDDVVVQYDEALGFPTSIEVRFDQGIQDAGSGYSVTAVAEAP
jgi:hypothetical protein